MEFSRMFLLRTRLLSALAAITVFVAFSACQDIDPGQDEPGVGLESSELIGAEEDPHHRWSVGVCAGEILEDGSCPLSGTPGTMRCSGTLIYHNIVLTAQHCVNRIDYGSSFCESTFSDTPVNETVQITTSSSVYDADARWYNVEEIVIPEDRNLCSGDVALLILDRPVWDAWPVGVDLDRDLAEDPPEDLVMVGRGGIAIKYDPETWQKEIWDDGNYERRIARDIPFYCAAYELGDCAVHDPWSDPSEKIFEVGRVAYGPATASGDSGCGVFDQDEFYPFIRRVISVNTTSYIGDDGYPLIAGGVRLDQHADMIRETTVRVADDLGWYIPYWAL